MFWNNPKEDQLRQTMVNMITRIEEINWESWEIILELWKSLAMFEELYNELYRSTSDSIRNDESILKTQEAITAGWEFVSEGLKTLNNKDTSLLDKNGTYPMLIDVIWGMILNHQIIISRINWLSK